MIFRLMAVFCLWRYERALRCVDRKQYQVRCRSEELRTAIRQLQYFDLSGLPQQDQESYQKVLEDLKKVQESAEKLWKTLYFVSIIGRGELVFNRAMLDGLEHVGWKEVALLDVNIATTTYAKAIADADKFIKENKQ